MRKKANSEAALCLKELVACAAQGIFPRAYQR